jgi:MarR-like DNA-binding transcriptional regulator SgrR of sgrS sRNA
VRVRLSHPDGWFLRSLAELPIVPYQIYRRRPRRRRRLIGSGPYKIVVDTRTASST